MLREPVLYPRAYSAYVLLAAADICLTYIILGLGGRELNKLAAWIFDEHGLTGGLLFKFTTVAVVLVSCEYVGRKRPDDVARTLALWAVLVSLAPVLVGGSALAARFVQGW